jgi:lipopolysaccharide transport system permease protein
MSAKLTISPLTVVRSFFNNKDLLIDLVKRDFIGRYQGSLIGVMWSLFNPLLMLAIYTLVFSVAFKARWGGGEESKVAFALVLFTGLIVHSFFAECINRAPTLILSHQNYVKKVVFPLEILTSMTIFSALLQLLVSLMVLIGFCFFTDVPWNLSALTVPILLIPLVLLTLGLSWILASLGVYFRDMAQVVGMFSTVALFLSPVFYPIDTLPATYRMFIDWNPITLPILQIRDVLLWNKQISWSEWSRSLGLSGMICYGGFWWFQKSRKGFADVL